MDGGIRYRIVPLSICQRAPVAGLTKRAQLTDVSMDPEDSSRDAPRRLLGAGGDTTKAEMQKIQHPSNNGVLGAPAGWDQGELPCNALPITRTHVGDLPAVVSYWRPDAEELAVLNAGGA